MLIATVWKEEGHWQKLFENKQDIKNLKHLYYGYNQYNML